MFSQKYRKGYAQSLVSGMRYGYKYAPVAKYLYNRYAGAPAPAVVKRSYKKVKKAPPRRRYRKNYRKKTLTKKVKDLTKKVNANQSTYIKKNRYFSSLKTSAKNLATYAYHDINSITILEAAIDSVKYFNPSVPGTLINVDLTSPSFQNQVRFTRNWAKMTARNNYVVPIECTIYVLKNKKDTSIAPTTAMDNSLTDMSNVNKTNPLIYPTDCHDFNDMWKIEKSSRKKLMPGEFMELSVAFPAFNYDVSLSDSHNTQYQKYFHGSTFLIRVTGCLSHGSTSGVALSQSGVDYSYERIHQITYPGGADITYLECDHEDETIVGTLQSSQLTNTQSTYSL